MNNSTDTRSYKEATKKKKTKDNLSSQNKGSKERLKQT